MRRFLLLLLLGILLVACDQAAAPRPVGTQSAGTQPAGTQPVQTGATPAASGATATGAYPAPDSAYPAPDAYPAPLPQGPQFTIDTPVRAADAQVTGKGPAGVPIKLINVARSSEVIGEATISSDGVFTVKVPAKL